MSIARSFTRELGQQLNKLVFRTLLPTFNQYSPEEFTDNKWEGLESEQDPMVKHLRCLVECHRLLEASLALLLLKVATAKGSAPRISSSLEEGLVLAVVNRKCTHRTVVMIR